MPTERHGMSEAPAPKPTQKRKSYTPAFDLTPAEGGYMEIMGGLNWLRMPLSFELSHINLWLLGSGDNFAVVDCGYATPATVAAWEKNLGEILPAGGRIRHILVTHFHPDHFGLAGQLHRATQAPVLMTAGEWAVVQNLAAADSGPRLEALYAPYYAAAGVPPDMHAKMLAKRKLYKDIITPPPSDVIRISGGQKLHMGGRVWEVITCGGHTPEHACLYNAEDRVLIAGDVVLPGITPNISYFPGDIFSATPLEDYIAALEKLKAQLPDDILILPSHGLPFRGLHKRIDDIIAHHIDRCRKLRDLCATEAASAYSLMQALFAHRELSLSDLFFALSETLAHLRFDVAKGDVTVSTGTDGIDYYSARK